MPWSGEWRVTSNKPEDTPRLAVRWHAAGQQDVPRHDRWLTTAEAERLNAMRFTKRRDESRLGRWTAKHAVARSLGLPRDPDDLREINIRNGSDGAPAAYIDEDPASVTISMTDRAGWAVCVVASGVEAVGCDLELVEPRSERFVADYFAPSERAVVAAAPQDHDLLANLIWSSKESALKVLHEGLRLDTRSVEVAFVEKTESGWSSLSVTTDDGRRFPGWWIQFDDFLLTFCATAATDAPAAMDQPSPLAGATPTHSWMTQPVRTARG